MVAQLIGWLAAFIILALIEAFSFHLVSVWFACGSIVAFISVLCGAPFWLQITLFTVSSLVLLAATRPLVTKVLKKKTIATNADSFIGKQGVVISEVNNVTGNGRVNVDGLDWSARSADNSIIPDGAVVTIEEIQGVKAIVKNVS